MSQNLPKTLRPYYDSEKDHWIIASNEDPKTQPWKKAFFPFHHNSIDECKTFIWILEKKHPERYVASPDLDFDEFDLDFEEVNCIPFLISPARI